jgi:hypothetical protein
MLLGKPLRTLGSIGDLEKIHQLMRKPEQRGDVSAHGAVRSGADRFFESEMRRTRRILGRPAIWRAVSVVADDLLSWGELSGHDVAETMQWAINDCRQMELFTGTNSGQYVVPVPCSTSSAHLRLAA